MNKKCKEMSVWREKKIVSQRKFLFACLPTLKSQVRRFISYIRLAKKFTPLNVRKPEKAMHR